MSRMPRNGNTSDPDDDAATGEIRERCETYDVGESTVVVISDPENPYAWIQSDVTEPNAP